MARGNGRNTDKEGSGRPTMTDIARIAGVSQSSVSLVLNEMSGSRISPETQQIGYKLPATRGAVAATPIVEKDTIAFIVDEISTSPHPVVSLDGIRDYAFEQGFLVSAHATRSNPDLEQAVLRSVLRDPSIVGVIYATIFTRKVHMPPELNALPTVLLNCYAEPRQQVAIVPGEVAGGFAATAHLTSLGHKRIGFINGEPWMEGLQAGARHGRHRLR
jgi:LacI family transcriptional regulator